jgi:hypothetical protein
MIPTVTVMVMQLRESAGYKEQESSLLRTFNALGFLWGKMRDNRRILLKNKMVEAPRLPPY